MAWALEKYDNASDAYKMEIASWCSERGVVAVARYDDEVVFVTRPSLLDVIARPTIADTVCLWTTNTAVVKEILSVFRGARAVQCCPHHMRLLTRKMLRDHNIEMVIVTDHAPHMPAWMALRHEFAALDPDAAIWRQDGNCTVFYFGRVIPACTALDVVYVKPSAVLIGGGGG